MGADADPQSNIGERGRVSPQLVISMGSIPLELREPCGRGGGQIVGDRGDEGTRRMWSTESTKQGSWGLTETEAAITEPAWVYARSSACMVVSLVFWWDP